MDFLLIFLSLKLFSLIKQLIIRSKFTRLNIFLKSFFKNLLTKVHCQLKLITDWLIELIDNENWNLRKKTFLLSGNILSILVLLKHDMDLKSNFLQILITLICFDVACIVFNLLLFCLPHLSKTFFERVFPYIVPTVLPLAQIALTGKILSSINQLIGFLKYARLIQRLKIILIRQNCDWSNIKHCL